MLYKPANFRSTVVKLYYEEKPEIPQQDMDPEGQQEVDQSDDNADPIIIHCGRGRPPGSRNKSRPATAIRQSSR